MGLIPNGAGKTTLFNLVTGTYLTSSGKILFNQKDLTALKPHEVTENGILVLFKTSGFLGK